MSIATKVLDLLTGDEPNQPRLTWYGPDDERVELSGRVLANWVTKATNLLVEEGEVGPGTRVLLDVPVHWRALVWAMATWCAGGELVLPPRRSSRGTATTTTTPTSRNPWTTRSPSTRTRRARSSSRTPTPRSPTSR
ncbi:TIGR03089 family protein [Georgenia wutianyii]|uniref:TIGR03089 family protein n=1 Tax=Georgenia wutianyii TaxID=2585135 RepID=UPI002ED927DB